MNQPAPQMSPVDGVIIELETSLQFFKNATRNWSENDSSFRPTTDALTVAGQIAHTAMTVDWFVDGAVNPNGFDMDFERHMEDLANITSVMAAREMLDNAYARAIKTFRSGGEAFAFSPMPEGPIMGGAPKIAIVSGIVEHTAHHRGSLGTYARINGTPAPMPYLAEGEAL